MKWLTKIFRKDDFINELNKHSGLYQLFFEKIEEVSDNKLWARLVLDPQFISSDECIKKVEKEEEKTNLIFEEATQKGLNQVVLLTAYIQYAVADPLFDQEKKKSYWISVIKNRKSTDSFPDHNAIVFYLKKIGYIE